MRTKLNIPSSTERRISDKLAMSGMSLSGMPLPGMNMEWLEEGKWRLPSGKALAEFALQSGFLAPLLFNVGQFGNGLHESGARELADERAASSRTKHLGKGSGQ